MRWDDVEEICWSLMQRKPPVDPRGLSEAEIVALVKAIAGFEGDGNGYNAGHIEAIRAGLWWGY